MKLAGGALLHSNIGSGSGILSAIVLAAQALSLVGGLEALMPIEHLPYRGESPRDRYAYQKYLYELRERGKSLLQLNEVTRELTPWIRQSWSPRTFTAVMTSAGEFDAVVCTISYHFNKRSVEGGGFASITSMTLEAQQYFRANRHQAELQPNGTLKLPKGTFEKDGRIITFHR